MATPSQLGPYRLLRELARGGMGSVHEAEHVQTGARYALKLLIPEGVGGHSEQALARFRRESETLAALNHPHIVNVHAAELEGRTPYLVQALLSQGTLEQRLATGPLVIDEAIELTLKLASGLEAAHGARILHRDLKPENVLFDDRGEPRLVDFGLALELAALERLSATGEVMGTPAYMAPEQAQGRKALDVRVDVYGLAAILHAMLTGKPPVRVKGSLFKILDAVANEPVDSLRALRSDLPRSVDAVVLRALAKKPKERHESVAAFAEALRRARAGEAATPPRWPIAAGAVALFLLVCAITFWPGSTTPPPDPDQAGMNSRHPVDSATAPPPELSEADRLLSLGDSLTARALAERALAEDPGNPDWIERRGWARLLDGDLAGARADLGPGNDALAVSRGWLELTQDLERIRGLQDYRIDEDEARKLLDKAERLAESARLIVKLPVAPPLLTRVQLAVARAPLHLTRTSLGSVSTSVFEVLELAKDLQPESAGAGALEVARAAVKYRRWNTTQSNKAEVAQRLRARVAKARKLPPAPAPWPALAWAVDVGAQLVATEEGEDCPPMPPLEPEGLGETERRILASSNRRLSGYWLRVLRRALLARSDHARTREAWTNALRYQRQVLRYLRMTTSVTMDGDQDDARLLIIVLQLAARRGREAQEMLDERRRLGPLTPGQVDAKGRFLQLECDLLLLTDASAVRKRSYELGQLIDQFQEAPALHCLRAAYFHRRIQLEKDDRHRMQITISLESAKRFPPGSFEHLHTGWRKPLETEFELGLRGSKLSQRAFLEQALAE